MSSLVNEIRNWNTSILGAYYLWEFTKGYTDNHKHGKAPIALLHFLASTILTNKRLSEGISGNREGLASYVKGFEDRKEIDILVSIHSSVEKKKKYTLEAIDIAISQGLLVWDWSDGRIYHRDITKKASKGKALNIETKKMGKKSNLLGVWFSEHEIDQIASLLKVVF